MVNRVAFAPDGARVATGNRDGSIVIWSTAPGGLRDRLHVDAPVDRLLLGAAGTVLAVLVETGSSDAPGTTSNGVVWDLQARREVMKRQHLVKGWFGLASAARGAIIADDDGTDDFHRNDWAKILGCVVFFGRGLGRRDQFAGPLVAADFDVVPRERLGRHGQEFAGDGGPSAAMQVHVRVPRSYREDSNS